MSAGSRTLAAFETIALAALAVAIAACGSGSSSETKVVPAIPLNAEVCTVGEARDTTVYVKNLDDFQWRDISVSLDKAGETYVRTQASLSPESQQAAEPFKDSREFKFRKIVGHVVFDVVDAERIIPLHNFSALEGATIEVSAPQPGEWSGEVHPCQ